MSERTCEPVPRWYMAGWSGEIGEALLSRRLDGARILLYRKDDGQIVALEGRDFWERKPVFLGIDAGGTRARRLLECIRRGRALTELAGVATAELRHG